MKKPKPTMNTKMFLEKLARVRGRGWRIGQGGEIRCQDGWCPILALYPRRARYNNDDVFKVAEALGIPTKLTNRITDAVDSFDPYYDTPARDPLRRKIKTVLGL